MAHDNLFYRNLNMADYTKSPTDFSNFIDDPLDMENYIRRRRKLSLISPEPFDEQNQLNTNRIPIAPNEFTNRSELYGMLQKSTEALDVLQEHLGRMPTRKPESTGRSIATSLLSGMAGYTSGIRGGEHVASTIRDSGYNRDLEEWRQRAAGLQDIAELTTQKSRVLGTIEDYKQRDIDRNEDRQRKIQEEENRHAEVLARLREQRDERLRKAGEDEETIRHNKVLEDLRQQEVGVSQSNAKSLQNYRSERLRQLGNIDKGPSIPEARQAEKDAVHEIIGADPRFAKFADYGNYNNPYQAQPEDQQDFQVFLVLVRQVAQRILRERQGKTVGDIEDDLEFEE